MLGPGVDFSQGEAMLLDKVCTSCLEPNTTAASMAIAPVKRAHGESHTGEVYER